MTWPGWTARAQDGAHVLPDCEECCGMDAMLTPDVIAAFRDAFDAGVYDFEILPTEVQRVGFTIHVVRDSNGSGGLAQYRVDQAIADANTLLGSSGIEFYQCGETRYLDDDDFYYNINTRDELDQLRLTDRIPGTINVYFTQNLAIESGRICGMSSFSWNPIQGIVMANGCVATSSNHSSFPHEVGHYFDLLHTHETAFGVECVERTNCDIAGDLICDTPADPNLTGLVDTSCRYNAIIDGPCTGDPPYDPDPSNLMSYSRPECRTMITPGQDDRALGVLMNLRPELLDPVCEGCLRLYVTDLIAGRNATFEVFGGVPGEVCALVWGNRDGERQFANGSWCVDFGFDVKSTSRVFVQGAFNFNGVLNWVSYIPQGTSGMNVRFQAAMKNTCPDSCMSNVWTGSIE